MIIFVLDRRARRPVATTSFVGLDSVNPVPRIQLIELAWRWRPTRTHAAGRSPSRGARQDPVEVDRRGCRRRLLFRYLFSAVQLQAETGMPAKDIDTCMKLGAGVPMGPMALLDFVGLDVAQAIGVALKLDIPPRLAELVEAGALGKKTKKGFYSYD